MTEVTFENLKAWEVARALTQEVHRLSGYAEFDRNAVLRDHLRRASGALGVSIGDGFYSSTAAMFLQHLHYAKRSASEVQTHLQSALDRGLITPVEFEDCYFVALRLKDILEELCRDVVQHSGIERRKTSSTNVPSASHRVTA